MSRRKQREGESGSKGRWYRPLLASLALLLALLLTGPGPAPQARMSAQSPNIILLLTDDQSGMLPMLDTMPHLQALLADQGMTFTNLLAPTPLCCPARVTLLTGQYAHNHQVLWNNPPLGGFQKVLDLDLESTMLGPALQDVGYRTALLGKYLNGYPLPEDPTYVPPGWDAWHVGITDSAYSSFNYQLNENGSLVPYGNSPDDYITDVLTRKAVNFITQTVTVSPSVPFFALVSVYAPHSPANPAPRHEDLFPDAQVPRAPSFNEGDMSDKPWFMQLFPPLTTTDLEQIDGLYRKQLQSMQAVDEMIAELVQTLSDVGRLDNTYILFASDNGLHMGHHRFMPGKGTPYAEDVNVPLVVRGPGVPSGIVRQDLVTLTDLTATVVDLAGTTMDRAIDGRSLLPLMQTPAPVANWRDGVLIEHYRPLDLNQEPIDPRWSLEPPDPFDLQLAQLDTTPPDYTGLQTGTYKYIRRIGNESELYDLVNDPFEVFNQVDNADPAFLAQLTSWLDSLTSCAGDTCRSLEDQEAPTFRLVHPRADINRDGTVDLADLSLVADCWSLPVTSTCGDRLDLNLDAHVDIVDVMLVAAEFGRSTHRR